jgi:hypothetical protein
MEEEMAGIDRRKIKSNFAWRTRESITETQGE